MATYAIKQETVAFDSLIRKENVVPYYESHTLDETCQIRAYIMKSLCMVGYKRSGVSLF